MMGIFVMPVVINGLNRDRANARGFLIRNQDKIMRTTDEGWCGLSAETGK